MGWEPAGTTCRVVETRACAPFPDSCRQAHRAGSAAAAARAWCGQLGATRVRSAQRRAERLHTPWLSSNGVPALAGGRRASVFGLTGASALTVDSTSVGPPHFSPCFRTQSHRRQKATRRRGRSGGFTDYCLSTTLRLGHPRLRIWLSKRSCGRTVGTVLTIKSMSMARRWSFSRAEH